MLLSGIDITQEFRERSRGNYYTDFSFLNEGALFPNTEMLDRNAMYLARYSQLLGEDSKGMSLLYSTIDEEFEVPIFPLGDNFFKLTKNKLLDLIGNNDWLYKTGNIADDAKIAKLMERTGAKNPLLRGIGNTLTYGATGYKVHKNGISDVLPIYVFKVVDASDYNKILGTGLYDVIWSRDNNTGVQKITHIRFEIHLEGWIFDIVYTAEGCGDKVKLGKSIDYTFTYGGNSRVIPAGGKWYKTGVDDCSLLQIAAINKDCDGVYGQSIFVDIQDNVYGYQQRLTIENSTLNNLTAPITLMGMSMARPNQKTGELEPKKGKNRIIFYNDATNAPLPQAFQQDYKLDNSEKLADRFLANVFLMSEMGKPYMCGDYGGGNLSTESMNNLIKPALDKGNRISSEVYYYIRDAIYCLAVLNDINIKKEDLVVMFNIGRTEDDEKITNIVTKLIPNTQVVSTKYVLQRYFGLDDKQAEEMIKQVEEERNNTNNMDNTQVFPPLQEDKEIDKDKDIITEDSKNKEQ